MVEQGYPALGSVSLAQWLEGQDTERLNRYRQYLDFYEGQQWDRRRRGNETRLTINYARALVRKVASHVFPEPVVFSVPESEEAERVLNELAAEQDWHGLDYQTLVDAAVLGDGAFKVTWDGATGTPLVTAVDPATVWAWTRPDNVRRLTRVMQRYTLSAEEAEGVLAPLDPRVDGVRPLYAAVSGARVTVVEDWTAERLVIEAGGQVIRDGPNPYGWIPYVLFPNVPKPHSLWGESDLADLLDVCRELNRRMTVLSKILQVSGNPIVVLENVTGSQGIRADEGAVWELPEDSKAYLLDMLSGGGVRLHIEYVELLYRALYDLAETPRSAFGDSGRNLSGAALEVEIQPLVQKVQRKRRVWDSVYRRRNAMVLDLLERFGGYDFGGVRRSEVVWGSILPRDHEALVRAEAQLVSSGIHSRRTAMAALGEEAPEDEWARVLEELEALGATPLSPPVNGGKTPVVNGG